MHQSFNTNASVIKHDIKKLLNDDDSILSENESFNIRENGQVVDECNEKDNSYSAISNINREWVMRNGNPNSSINLMGSLSNKNDKSSIHTDVVKNDSFNPNLESFNVLKKYVQKLPLHFIDIKDWQLYLKFSEFKDCSMTQDSKIGNELITGFSKNKNKVQRLLNSVHNLYREYSELSNNYEVLRKIYIEKQTCSDLLVSCDSDSIMKNPVNNLTHSNDEININNSKMLNIYDTEDMQKNSQIKVDSSSQTIQVLEWSELSESCLGNLLKSRESFNSEQGASLRTNDLTLSLEASPSASKGKHAKIYDRLLTDSFLSQSAIDIIEEVQMSRPKLVHKIKLISQVDHNSSSDSSSDDHIKNDTHPNFIFNSIATAFRCATSKSNHSAHDHRLRLTNLPILFDMMLPKIQLKINQIFEECPFLNNPMEIMAELRSNNYNKNKTIAFFNLTKDIRGSLKDFISNHLDSRCRTAVLRSLSRDYNLSCDKNETRKSMFCLNCTREFENIDILKASNILDRNIFTKEEDLDYIDTLGENKISFNSVHLAASRADMAMIDIMSKSTEIGLGIMEITGQDSFSQTLSTSVKMCPEMMHDFSTSIIEILAFLRKSIRKSKTQLAELRKQVSSLLKALKNNIDLIITLSSKQFTTDQNQGNHSVLVQQVEELKLKLKSEETKRRSVYNLMQEQMGNVRVYCRCRDIPGTENILEIQGNESILLPIFPQEIFDFDNVFFSKMKQKDVYEEFKPLVMSFIDGFNVCFITYGSEASGKTYTLIGGNIENEDDHGIMQRALNTVLTEQKLRDRDWDYKVTACLIEIYNDNCIDILSGEKGIQLYVDCGMESVYQKLKSVPIADENDAELLLHLCRVKRKVARTALNPASSRSHLITLIRLEGKSRIHGENIRSFMCLCDLAGFEDIIKAETQSNKVLSKEAGYINKSLTAFNRVFVSLRRQDPNTVCYRDAKLTHILKPFLTNSGKCALIITIRTDRTSLSSTQNTLRFGRETRGVTLGKARRQVNINR